MTDFNELMGLSVRTSVTLVTLSICPVLRDSFLDDYLAKPWMHVAAALRFDRASSENSKTL